MKGDTIKPENILKELRKSEIGQDTLDYIISENLDVQVYYDIDNTPPDILGLCYGKHIEIFALNTKTKKQTAKTLIHEVTHIKYGISGDQWAETVCELKALQHEKGTLTLADKKAIIREVKRNYPEMKWRSKK